MEGTPQESEPNEAVGEDVEGPGGERELHEPGMDETQREAPAEDVGVPGDEDIGKPD
jgi:hypothetical protein